MVVRRYERGSLLVTTTKHWGATFGDDVLTAAILDRGSFSCVERGDFPCLTIAQTFSLATSHFGQIVRVLVETAVYGDERRCHRQTYTSRRRRLTAPSEVEIHESKSCSAGSIHCPGAIGRSTRWSP